MEALEEFNTFPEYEIWFYHFPDMDEEVFFIFGNEQGSGRFKLMDGIEDFIPSRAFARFNARKTKGIVPGAIIASLYYSELMHLHPYFEDRFNELQAVWDRLERTGARPAGRIQAKRYANRVFRSKHQLFEAMDKTNPLRLKAPRHFFNFVDSMKTVKLGLIRFDI